MQITWEMYIKRTKQKIILNMRRNIYGMRTRSRGTQKDATFSLLYFKVYNVLKLSTFMTQIKPKAINLYFVTKYQYI